MAVTPQGPRPRAPRQLPPGRHGLPRGYVLRNQRERILDAVVNVVADCGYAAMTVEDIIAYAGVSRRTFYEHFLNKEQAFLAAYDLVVHQVLAAVNRASAGGATWPERVRLGLGAFLVLLAEEPTLARVCMVDVLAAGPNALARRADAMNRFQDFLVPDDLSGIRGLTVPPLAAETAIGGLHEVIFDRVLRGETAALPSLLPELLHTFLLPFAGGEVAIAEYHVALRELDGRRDAAARA
jgi:AcrR family transcriptional regulator